MSDAWDGEPRAPSRASGTGASSASVFSRVRSSRSRSS